MKKQLREAWQTLVAFVVSLIPFTADTIWRWKNIRRVLLASIPFLVCLAAYIWVAYVRHAENPDEKMVPTISQIIDALYKNAFELNRKGEHQLLVDSIASLRRFGISVGLLVVPVLIGLCMGSFKRVEELLIGFVTFFDKLPALALLPILMIALGLGEVTKVALIIIGVGPTIALDTYLNAKNVPREHILASMTLGASKYEIMWRVILPQLKPKIINAVRLNLKGMLLFLIAGESLAAAVGLGYRIFVVQRFFAMDVIIGYVVFMAASAFVLDMLLRGWNWYRYSWNGKGV